MNSEFSRAAVASILAAVVTALLEAKGQVPEPPEPPAAGAGEADFLENVLDHWEGHTLKDAPPWLLHQFRDIRQMLDWTIRYQASFGPTPERPN